jgi:toxin FitB
MYIFDTNVVSELRKMLSGRAALSVSQWAQSIPPDDVYLSSIVIYEIKLGILKLAPRDGKQAALLDAWLSDQILPTFSGKILPIDEKVAILVAHMMTPQTRPFRDVLIAATAQHYDYTVVTRNVRDFANLPVKVFNPWDFK